MFALFLFYLFVGNGIIYALRNVGIITEAHPSHNTVWYWGLDVLIWPLIVFVAYLGIDDEPTTF